MTGCVQQVLRPSITAAAARVLAAQGVEVRDPRRPRLLRRAGRAHAARGTRRATGGAHRGAFPADVDAIVVTAAGCGSWMKDHPHAGPPALDVDGVSWTAWACAEPLRLPTADARPRTRTPATWLHGQQVSAAPRRLLAAVGASRSCRWPTPGCAAARPASTTSSSRTWPPNWARGRPRPFARRARASWSSGNIGCLTQLAGTLGAAGGAGPPYDGAARRRLCARSAGR